MSEKEEMKDKKIRKHKKVKVNEVLKDDMKTTKKIINSDEVDHSVRLETIKKRLKNLKFHSFEVKTEEEGEFINEILSGLNDKLGEKLDGKILDFIYSELFLYRVDIQDKKNKRIIDLTRNNRKKLAQALNMERTIKNINLYISQIDGVTDPEIRETLPRYKKLQSLENAYDFVLNYGMNLIHYYYWFDFSKLEDNGLLLEECIEKAAPKIYDMKVKLEKEIYHDYEIDSKELKQISLGYE